MMTLYHGSSVSVSEPLTGVGRRELDFGPGFYLTNLREQAERWARRVCIVRAADSRQAIVDHCLRFVGTEAVTEKGGQG